MKGFCFVILVLCALTVMAETPRLESERKIYQGGELVRLHLIDFAPIADGAVMVLHTPNDRAFPETTPSRFSYTVAQRQGDWVSFPAPLAERNGLIRFLVRAETKAGWQQARVDLGIVNPGRAASLTAVTAGGRDTFLEGEMAEVRVILKTAVRIEPTPLELRAQEYIEFNPGQWIAVGQPYTLATAQVFIAGETEHAFRFALRTSLLKTTRYELQARMPKAGLTSNHWTIDVVAADPVTHFPIFERDDFLTRLASGQMPHGGHILRFAQSLTGSRVNCYVEPRSKLKLDHPWPKRLPEDSSFESVSDRFAHNSELKQLLDKTWQLPSDAIRIIPSLGQNFDEALLRSRIGWREELPVANLLSRAELTAFGDALLSLEPDTIDFVNVNQTEATLRVQRGGLANYILITPAKAPQRLGLELMEAYVLYDATNQAQMSGKAQKKMTLDVRDTRPRVLVALPRPIERLELVALAAPGAFRVIAQDAKKQPLDAVIPVEIVVRDPTGELRARRFRTTGRDEVVKIGVNDRPGQWSITATELLTGRWVSCLVTVGETRDIPLSEAAKMIEEAMAEDAIFSPVPNYQEIIEDQGDLILRRLVLESGTPVFQFDPATTTRGLKSQSVERPSKSRDPRGLAR